MNKHNLKTTKLFQLLLLLLIYKFSAHTIIPDYTFVNFNFMAYTNIQAYTVVIQNYKQVKLKGAVDVKTSD